MATIPTVSHGAYPQSSRRTYMSIRAFNGSFFSYTVTQGPPPTFTTTGTLAAVTGANSTNCPAGRTLRENGKKLFPSANPGVSTYMVGVYDANSGLSGFIDPNDSVFTLYNTDKPTYIADGVSATDNATVDKAPGVYTRGDIVTTGGNISASGNLVASGLLTLSGYTNRGTIATGTDLLMGSTTTTFQRIDFNGNVTYTTSTFPAAGTILMIEFVNITNSSIAVTLGSGFNASTTVAPSANGGVLANSKAIVVTFYCNGTSLSEIARGGQVTQF